MRFAPTSARTLAAVAVPSLLVVALLAAAISASAAEAQTVEVWFLQGEQMIAVERPGETVADAMGRLLAGPTAAEVKLGATVRNGVAFVDVSLAFVKGRDAASLRARLSQLVHTASGPEGATKVRLTPKPPAQGDAPVLASVRASQERLVELGFLLARDVDGQAGLTTQSAVLAFQKWEGLQRDGVYDAPALGTLKARAPLRYGPFLGVIRTGEAYGIAMPKGSPLLGPVNRAIGRFLEDGTIEKLQREWITAHLEELRVLR